MEPKFHDDDIDEVHKRLAELEKAQKSLNERIEGLGDELGKVGEKAAENLQRAKNSIKIVLLLGLTVAALLYTNQVPPSRLRLLRDLYNTGHIPLFGAVALVLLGVSKMWLRDRVDTLVHYFIAAIGVALAGMAHEALQFVGSRDADPLDLLRDLVGGGVVLSFVLTFETTAERPAWLRRRRWLVRGLAVAVLLLSLAPLTLRLTAYIRQHNAFPQIAAFEEEWEERFVLTNEGSNLQIVPPPSEWMGSSRGSVGRVDFVSGQYPKLELIEPVPDWRGYQQLALEVFSPGEDPIDLEIRIHDRRHDGDFSDRFNRSIRLDPGANHLTIELEDVERAPRGRQLDLSSVASVILFMVAPTEPVTLYFDDIRLQ